MRVVLTDGEELGCKNFKALDGGVLLTKDKKRKKVVGYVPNHQLRYVVDEDVVVTPSEPETMEEPETEAQTLGDRDGRTERDDSAEETASVNTDAGDAPIESGESDLKRLGGLGTTYAERLQSAGYDSIAALAEADPVAVAEAASVAPGRGRRWVDAAKRMTADSDESAERGEGVDEE